MDKTEYWIITETTTGAYMLIVGGRIWIREIGDIVLN